METSKSFFQKHSVIVKISMIAVLTLLMLIPVNMVQSLIREREENKTIVQEEISDKWGGQQRLVGPVLVLPYKTRIAEGNPIVVKYAYFLPDEYNIEGEIKPEERSRGIYQVLCYQSLMQVKGKFSFPDYEKLNLSADQIQWEDAFLLVGVPALQGIKNKIDFNVNGKSLDILASVAPNDLISSGLTVKMPLNPTDIKEAYNFNFDLALNGTDGLYFAPIGKHTSIHMKSEYKTVTFIGDFLPNSRKIDQSGFDAQWEIFDYNRNYAQMWIGQNSGISDSLLGVDLLLPVDQYQKTMRSAKYAIMFIVLTFVVFFMVELLNRKRIHPVQYLLVSFALVLFYSLLLALSEYIGFEWSYLISALAIVSLITSYSYSIFKSKKQASFMGVFLCILYVFLYVILQLEDMALLLGSAGLFITLAIVMYVSRKVDWYKEDDRVEQSLN